jgi:large subunit ribosomal protein L6
MSRIGKQPITIPSGVKVNINNSDIDLNGVKGKLHFSCSPRINVKVEGQSIIVERLSNAKTDRALHGLTRTLINNMVKGVSEGYVRDLELVGVGYRAQLKGNAIEFSLGYSHPVEYPLPEGITAEIDKKQTKISLKGIDKQQLGQLAANLRGLRKPDAYKGKGVRYANEVIKLKPGKTGSK